MANPVPEYTVKWALFSFKGRLSRKSFWLGALLMVLVQFAMFAAVAGLADPQSGRTQLEDGPAILVGFAFMGMWIATAWAVLAMSVKRLHDLSMPGVLAILLLVPAIAFFAFLFLAFMPSRQETNRHGAPPFPRN